jgi:hypothetical protein
MPWASKPVRSASVIALAAVAASAAGTPQAISASRVNAISAAAGKRRGSDIGAAWRYAAAARACTGKYWSSQS